MEWFEWFTMGFVWRFPFLGIGAVLFSITYLLFRRWLRNKRRAWYLPLGFLTAIVGMAVAWPSALGLVLDFDRFELARQLGVSATSRSSQPNGFPLHGRLAGMTSEPTTVEEAHQLLESAKLRYECHSRDKFAQLTDNLAEKYLFYSDNYYSPRAEVINVFYDERGIVTRVMIGVGDVDGLPLRDCSLP